MPHKKSSSSYKNEIFFVREFRGRTIVFRRPGYTEEQFSTKKKREHSIRHIMIVAKEDFRSYLSSDHFPRLRENQSHLLDQEKRKKFSSNNSKNGINTFNYFYEELTNILIDFDLNEVETIATNQPSFNVKRLLVCFDILNNAGFHTVNNKPINFWCGQLGKEKAREDNCLSYSDFSILATNVIFKLSDLILYQETNDAEKINLSKALSRINSAIFASQAQGCVDVYIASDKKQEKAGLTAHNYFWNAELPVLQRLFLRGIVTKICVHLYDEKDKLWKQLNINKDKKSGLCIRRRSAYKSLEYSELNDQQSERFQREFPLNTQEYKLWQMSDPRPSLEWRKLKKIANIWKEKSNYSKSIGFLSSHFYALLKTVNTTGNIELQDSKGNTLLINAARRGYFTIVQSLIMKKANVNARNFQGETALMAAVDENQSAIVSLLLKNKASTFDRDNRGKTALMHAASSHVAHAKVVKTLLQYNGNIMIHDGYGNNVLFFARQAKKEIIEGMLEKALDEKITEFCKRVIPKYNRSSNQQCG